MTAPRLREQRRPPSPPDTLPSRRDGGSSPCTYAASSAGRPASSARPRVARRGFVSSARALAAAALLALSGVLALPAQAQTTCTLDTAAGDLWCGVVTVALHTTAGLDVGYGFVDASATTNTSDTGALSDETFSVGGNYTIDTVVTGLDTAAGTLTFGLTSNLSAADKEKLVLHVGSRSFAFDGASPVPGNNYQWSNTGLDWSSESTVTLRLRVLPPPAAPTNLTASPGDRRVTLAWDAPAADADITRHEFRYKWRTTGDYIPWQAIPDSAPGGGNASGYTPPGASDDYTATGYPNLIDHVFQVRAVNAAGESGPSNEAAVTPLDPKAPPAPTVRAPANTAGLLAVSWTAVAGASAYEVRYWPADEDGRSFQIRRTRDTSALIRPLAANTEYRVSVAAQGGPWSEVATARTGAQQASKPIMSLQVVDGSGNDIVTVTAGGTFRYRIKLANIRNHHLTFDGGSDPDYDSEHHGWGTLGIRGVWAMDFVLDGDPEGSKLTCESESLFLRDFVETSPTSGYWEFESPGLPFDADERGPLRLRLGFRCTGRHNGASTEIDDDDGEFDVEESPPRTGSSTRPRRPS